MTQIGSVPEIEAVKKHLSELQRDGIVKEWEVPYENVLTRLTAAIFFLTPTERALLPVIWIELKKHKMLHYRLNDEKKISQLEWRVEFNKEPELAEIM
jgi:hypothetical protein